MSDREKQLAFLLVTGPHLIYASGCAYEEAAKDLIANGVVPVVRCKDCKFYNNHGMKDVVFDHDACHWNADEQPNPDDFCSAGERKDDASGR